MSGKTLKHAGTAARRASFLQLLPVTLLSLLSMALLGCDKVAVESPAEADVEVATSEAGAPETAVQETKANESKTSEASAVETQVAPTTSGDATPPGTEKVADKPKVMRPEDRVAAAMVGREAAPPPRQRALQSRKGDLDDISFDDIKLGIGRDDRFEKTDLTPRVTDLNGKRVRIRGFMLPSYQQTGLKQFVLVRDNMECCFGPGAALYDCVVVDMKEGTTAEFNHLPISVEGKFELHEWPDPDDPEGKQLAIYHLVGEKAK